MTCTNKEKYSFIFPGSGVNTLQSEINEKSDSWLKSKINEYSRRVRGVTGIDIYDETGFHATSEIDGGLLDQVIIYTQNCIIAEYYKELGIKPAMLCGYSMGIYSALVCGKAISFETGLDMIRSAYGFMDKSLKNGKGAMAAIIGFRKSELEKIIADAGNTMPVEIASENGEYNMVITGLKEDVSLIKKCAHDEGALKIVDIKVEFPYHNSYFLSEAAERLRDYLNNIEIDDTEIPLISCISQDIFNCAMDVRLEIYNNIKCNMSFYKSLVKMSKIVSNSFCVAGAGNSLQKIIKAIDQNYKTYGIENIAGGHYGLQQKQSI